jgi:hypothetical protein
MCVHSEVVVGMRHALAGPGVMTCFLGSLWRSHVVLKLPVVADAAPDS